MSRLLATALLTVVGASVIAFAFMHLAPMDPARFMIGFRPGVREEQVRQLRAWYGLDDPIPVQYARWMGRALRGDFGTSVTTRREVAPEIWRRLPWSLLLAAVAGLGAWALAVPLAVLGARRGPVAWVAGSLITAGTVVPAFLVATIMVYVFAVRLTLIPILPPFDLNLLDRALWLGLVLPAVSIVLPLAAWVAQQLHEDLVTVRDARYLEVALAKGFSAGRVAWRHAARVVTRTFLARPLGPLSLLFSGVLLVEEIFNWPGVGRSFTRALQQRDIPVMQATLLVLALMAVAIEVLTRLAVGRIGTQPEVHAAAASRGPRSGRPTALRAFDRRARLAAAVAGLLLIGVIAAPVIARFPPDQVLLDEINMAPSLRHWMGTDSSGRDLFGRLLFAGRTTLGITLGGAAAAALLGLLLTSHTRPMAAWRAAVAGTSRVVLSLPALGLLLAVVAAAGRAPALIAGAFAVLGAAAVVGRLSVLQAAAWRWPFVEAAQAAGASTLRIRERHLLPHLIRPLAAVAAGLVPGFILLEATLGFLGFSVSPTTPSWGTLLWRAREAMHRGDWWLIVFPAAFLAVTAWAYAALAEALGRAHPPTYPRPARLRLGREWGTVPAIPERTPPMRHPRVLLPRQTAIARPVAEPPAVNRTPGIAGGDVSGGSSD